MTNFYLKTSKNSYKLKDFLPKLKNPPNPFVGDVQKPVKKKPGLKRDLVLSDEAESITVPEESRALVDSSCFSNKSEWRYAFLSRQFHISNTCVFFSHFLFRFGNISCYFLTSIASISIRAGKRKEDCTSNLSFVNQALWNWQKASTKSQSQGKIQSRLFFK